jgi:hypothetical protein
MKKIKKIGFVALVSLFSVSVMAQEEQIIQQDSRSADFYHETCRKMENTIKDFHAHYVAEDNGNIKDTKIDVYINACNEAAENMKKTKWKFKNQLEVELESVGLDHDTVCDFGFSNLNNERQLKVDTLNSACCIDELFPDQQYTLLCSDENKKNDFKDYLDLDEVNENLMFSVEYCEKTMCEGENVNAEIKESCYGVFLDENSKFRKGFCDEFGLDSLKCKKIIDEFYKTSPLSFPQPDEHCEFSVFKSKLYHNYGTLEMRKKCKSDDEAVKQSCHDYSRENLSFIYIGCGQFSREHKKNCHEVVDQLWRELGVPFQCNEAVKRHEVIKTLNPALIQYISQIEDSTKFENNLSTLFNRIVTECKVDFDTVNTPCMSKCHSYIDAYNQKVKSAITMNLEEEACHEEAKTRVNTLQKQIDKVIQAGGDVQEVAIVFIKAEPEKFEKCLKR